MVEKPKPDGLTRAYETLLYAHILDRLGLEPGLDYNESVSILENAQKADPVIKLKLEGAIAYAIQKC